MDNQTIRATLERSRTKALATIIADLLNENEPLLRASAEGATVTVKPVGESAVMRLTVEHESRG